MAESCSCNETEDVKKTYKKKKKKRWSSDSENSTSSSSFLIDSRKNTPLPCAASLWKTSHLELIGVQYSDKTCSLEHIMSLIIAKTGRGFSDDLPEITKMLLEFTKEVFLLSFQLYFPHATAAGMDECDEELVKLMNDYNAKENDIKLRHKDLLDKPGNWRIFQRWSIGLLDFLTTLDSFLTRWVTRTTTVGSYRELFSQFCRIFLLKPEPGEVYKSSEVIKGQQITSHPDIRFNTFPQSATRGRVIRVVTMTEMKHISGCRLPDDGEKFNSSYLPSDILGKHGAELLVELKDSYFYPAISGIICIGTKIIFTYLEADLDGVCTQRKPDISDPQPVIHYTRPYDFMDASQRSEILDSLFWFGYVQSAAYKLWVKNETLL